VSVAQAAGEQPAGQPHSAGLAALAVAAAWSTYLPLGIQYVAFLAMGAGSLVALGRGDRLRELPRHPMFLATAAFWAWLATSAAWSPAPRADVVAHLWSYGLALWVVPMSMALHPNDASRAVAQFLVVSAGVAGLMVVGASGAWVQLPGWHPFVSVTGNQRIAYSLLLALASALALLRVLDSAAPRTRALWAACALLCAAGLALQDRRSGMLVLPLLVALLAWMRQPTWPRRAALVAGVMTVTALAWAPLDGVQQRFAEGVAELRTYRSQGDVDTSWGMRLRMVETTAAMVGERPLVGFGIGSWATQWRLRQPGGLLEGHTTPHNEYLLIAMQGGAIGLALAALMFGVAVRAAHRQGCSAHAAVLVCTTLVAAAAFNAVLRDTKFALPLLTLAALAWAAGRKPTASRR